MSDEIKKISLGTWITIIMLIATAGANYGVLQSNLQVIETKMNSFEVSANVYKTKQEDLLYSIFELQRKVDKNYSEIEHLKESKHRQIRE